MPDLKELFDAYGRKARLFPGLLLCMPVGIAVIVMLPAFDPKSLVPLVVAAGLPIFIANAVRSHGKHLESKLVARWGGMPTTQMLRHAGPIENHRMFRQRRQRLEGLLGETLPTAEDEAADPDTADEHYIAATKSLIVRVREAKDRFRLVDIELADYGFRRNLAGLKPIALVVLALLLGGDALAFVMGTDPRKVLIIGAFHLACAIAWLAIVRPSWVREQAESYAERLFETLEEPTLMCPPA
jgi:hypothetical protein